MEKITEDIRDILIERGNTDADIAVMTLYESLQRDLWMGCKLLSTIMEITLIEIGIETVNKNHRNYGNSLYKLVPLGILSWKPCGFRCAVVHIKSYLQRKSKRYWNRLHVKEVILFALKNTKGEYLKKESGIWKFDKSSGEKFVSIVEALSIRSEIYREYPMCGLLRVEKI